MLKKKQGLRYAKGSVSLQQQQTTRFIGNKIPGSSTVNSAKKQKLGEGGCGCGGPKRTK